MQTKPHDHESEEGLIACCLLERSALVEAIEAGVNPECFFKTAHQAIWEGLMELSSCDGQQEINEIELIDLLRKKGLEDDVGGIAAIYLIQKRVETPAHARFFIKKVLEEYSRRQLEKEFRKASEAICDSGKDISEVVADVQKTFEQISGMENVKSIKDFKWSPEDEPDNRPDLFKFADRVPLRRGNISILSGKAKSGKTSFRNGLIASCFTDEADCLGWKSKQSQGAVLVFDYEQSKDDFINGNRRIWKRAGEEPSERFYAYRFRDHSLNDAKKYTLRAINLAYKEQGKIDLIVVDGGADLIADINQIDQANEAVSQWLEWSSKYDCHICVIIHTNEGQYSGDDPHGHLGKEASRKGEVTFILKKNLHDETIVYTRNNRKAGIVEKQAFTFKWNDSKKMHTSIGIKADNELAELHELASKIWSDSMPGTQKRAKDIIASIMKIKGCEKRNADYLKQKLVQCAVLKKGIHKGQWIYEGNQVVQYDDCTAKPTEERLCG